MLTIFADDTPKTPFVNKLNMLLAASKTLELLRGLMANGSTSPNFDGCCVHCERDIQSGEPHERDCPYVAAVAHLKELDGKT